MFFCIIGFLSFLIMFGGFALLLSLPDKGLTIKTRGNIRRWVKEFSQKNGRRMHKAVLNVITNLSLAVCEFFRNAFLFIQKFICVLLMIFGFVVGAFSLFFGSEIGNPPVWEQVDYITLERMQNGAYILPNDVGDYEFLAAEKNEKQSIPASLLSFSLQNPMGFWSSVKITKNSFSEPHLVAYVGSNNTDTIFYRYVVYVPYF